MNVDEWSSARILFDFAAIDEAMPAQIAQYDLEYQVYLTALASQVASDKVRIHTRTPCALPSTCKLG